MTKQSKQAVGIFDSGIGGLTVAHAVAKLLPHEDIVYFGDTAHLPYGDKSTAAIQSYAVKICDCLLQQECKVILIACNSASAAAYELVKEYVGSRALVLDVIEPIIQFFSQQSELKKVGLIGTRQTVNSNIYKKKLDFLGQGIELQALATPMLAPMIEEGWCNNVIIDSVLEAYLSDPVLAQVEALILACTHYPLVKKRIEAFYQNKVDVIDGSLYAAKALQHLLREKKLLNSQAREGKLHFYVSDYTDSFAQSAALFFQDKVTLEHYPLWE